MSVRIRMSRIGRTNRPFFRIGAYDSHAPRNGKTLEILGWYDPTREKAEEKLRVKLDRVQHWLSLGALPTEKTEVLLKKAGVIFKSKAKPKKKKKDQNKKSQPETKKAPEAKGAKTKPEKK